jgi:hypothetical protein
MRSTGVGVVASDAFATEGTPPEAVRVCLGGPATRFAVHGALEFMAHALTDPRPWHPRSFDEMYHASSVLRPMRQFAGACA